MCCGHNILYMRTRADTHKNIEQSQFSYRETDHNWHRYRWHLQFFVVLHNEALYAVIVDECYRILHGEVLNSRGYFLFNYINYFIAPRLQMFYMTAGKTTGCWPFIIAYLSAPDSMRIIVTIWWRLSQEWAPMLFGIYLHLVVMNLYLRFNLLNRAIADNLFCWKVHRGKVLSWPDMFNAACGAFYRVQLNRTVVFSEPAKTSLYLKIASHFYLSWLLYYMKLRPIIQCKSNFSHTVSYFWKKCSIRCTHSVVHYA